MSLLVFLKEPSPTVKISQVGEKHLFKLLTLHDFVHAAFLPVCKANFFPF
jgi:hypothetical protein